MNTDALKGDIELDEKKKAEKYIRTFAGDMQTIQSGGTPDFAPLKEGPEIAPGPKERLVTASPIVLTPPEPAAEAMVATPPPPREPQYVPVPAAEAPIETYASDFTERMKDTRASTATVLAAEQDSLSAPIEQGAQEPTSKWAALYIAAGVLLFIVGAAGAFVAYTRYQAASEPVIEIPIVRAPIFVDEREQISGKGGELLAAFEASFVKPLASNAVRFVYTDATATTSLFALLPLSAPSILVRNIDPADSMAGVVNVGGTSGQSPFFILSVASYSNTFAGMLSWEKTMLNDLGRLYPAYSEVSVAQATSTVSTSSPKVATSTIPAIAAGFIDTLVANHDVRMYRDTAGRSVLLYGYWDQTTLVIARNAAAFSEIVERLASSRAQN